MAKKTDRPSRREMIRAIGARRRAELDRASSRLFVARLAARGKTFDEWMYETQAPLREIMAAYPPIDDVLDELLVPLPPGDPTS